MMVKNKQKDDRKKRVHIKGKRLSFQMRVEGEARGD